MRLLVSFLIGVVLTNGYRVDSFSGKVEAKSKSSGRVTFHRVRAKGETQSNSSIFISTGLLAFAGTACAVSSAPGVVTATAAATTLAANCAPSLAVMGGTVAAGAAAPPLAAIVVPLAVIVVLAVIGGLVLLHTAAVAAAAAVAFCPVSSFAQEPMNVLVSMEPSFAFEEDLPPLLEDGLDGGMPACTDLKKKELQQTLCGPNDRECLEKACRTKCCEDDQCTFYQFELEEGDDLINPSCQIGAKHKLNPENCEKPYFGEACVSRVPLWDKAGDGQCFIGYSGGNGFEVEDQLDCQNVAKDNGHCWYQYNAESKTCLTCVDYDTGRARKAIDGWAVYHDPTCDGTSVDTTVPCGSWQLKAALLSPVKDTKKVKPSPRGCRDLKATCMKKRCRAECQADPDCKFYQFQEDENWCYLGHKDAVGDADLEHQWIGGFLSEARKCRTGFQCPSNNKCVDSCTDDCPGFSIDGDEVKEAAVGKAASGKWCVRDAVENLCFEGNWDDSYQGVKVDEWCRGLERVTVTIDETLDATETGEKICRTTCCGDPDCSLYQMYEKDAEKTFTDASLFKNGKKEKVSCWLGMQTPGQKPKFKCTGNRPKRWRNLPSPRGMALRERGCSQGSIACLVKHGCVEHCATECMGADIHNKERGVCEPRTSLADEHLGSTEEERQAHKLAFKTNLVSGLPKISESSKLADDSYFLLPDDVEMDSPAAKDQLLHVQSHAQNIINPRGGQDFGAACETLKDNTDDEWLCWLDDVSGACKCEFGEPQNCDAWFKNTKHMKHVVDSEAGMMLFPGDQCHCDHTENEDGAYECTFKLMAELPPLRTVENTEAVMELKATVPKECPDMAVPCAGYDSCSKVQFGTHACGYECTKANGLEFWCSKDCVCNKEIAGDEPAPEAMCSANHVCDGMVQCDVIDYGDYGCGYGCKNANGVFHFCEHTCECEA
jgi:hypothetical protein